jgi:hypothetical protein
MNDPFLDTMNEGTSLQKPIAPSRSTTPVVPPIPPQPQPDSTSIMQEIEVNQPNLDVTALFDPLGGLTPTPRAAQSAFVVPATNRKPADDSNQPTKRRPTLLSIITPSNPPPVISNDPLSDLLGTQNQNQDQRPKLDSIPKPKPVKPSRQFSTPPLFQPPQPTYMHLPRRTSHIREGSDEFGGFVSVPASTDPLSVYSSANNSTAAIATSTPAASSLSNTGVVNDFTAAAQQRHLENSSRIMGEFAHMESSGGDFLGWLDTDPTQESEETKQEKSGDDRGEWLAERDKKLKTEEGPHSPPATPNEGPPPSMRSPKQKVHKGDHTERHDSDSGVHINVPERDKSQSRERKDVASTSGIGSYFPATLPRRLTTLLSNPTPATATMSPTVRITGMERVEDHGDDENDIDPDARGVFALPGSSSLENLSSMNHSRIAKSIPDSFLTHHTPFATVRYIPPSGAPGYAGEGGWDTGGFAADWEGEEGFLSTDDERRRKSTQQLRVKRVLKLIGRKEETAGVLTRALGDAVSLIIICHCLFFRRLIVLGA